MLVVGIDENGLGPLLGPLVVTAAAFHAPAYDRERFWRLAEEGRNAGDSKKLFSRNRLKSAEKATWSWLRAFGVEASSHGALCEAICLPLPVALPCGSAPDICRPSAVGLPLFPDNQPGDGAERPIPWADAEIRPAAMRAYAVCPGAFNRANAIGSMNKLRLDFDLMMALLRDFATSYPGEIFALCGKVGSTRRYGPWLDGAGESRWSVLEEGAFASAYAIASVGKVSFVQDADSLHLPVAVASMAGKYLRELAMRDLNDRIGWPGLPFASGYRDPVTRRFVEQTATRRRQLGLCDDCFLRRS